MAVGTRPVSEISKTLSLAIYLNTGTMDAKGNPVINRANLSAVNSSAAIEDLYDASYMYAGLTSKSLVGISINSNSDIGPID